MASICGQHISFVGRELIDASIFMVGRPGLDPGTLGLKVQIKRLQPDASCYSRSQMAGAKRNRKSGGDGPKRGETWCDTVVGNAAYRTFDDSLTIAGTMRAESLANDPEAVYGIGLSERYALLGRRRASSGGSASFRKVPNVSMASAYPYRRRLQVQRPTATIAGVSRSSLSSSINPRPCIWIGVAERRPARTSVGGRGRVALFEQDPQVVHRVGQVVHRVGDAKSAARSRQRWAQAGPALRAAPEVDHGAGVLVRGHPIESELDLGRIVFKQDPETETWHQRCRARPPGQRTRRT